MRRAASVKAELIRDGVPANEIVTLGVGEADPAVPTPDGVREPRNRAAHVSGSIHDDATASKLGFRGGTVAGSVIFQN